MKCGMFYVILENVLGEVGGQITTLGGANLEKKKKCGYQIQTGLGANLGG